MIEEETAKGGGINEWARCKEIFFETPDCLDLLVHAHFLYNKIYHFFFA